MGKAGSGAELLHLVAQRHPDVLLDLAMPDMEVRQLLDRDKTNKLNWCGTFYHRTHSEILCQFYPEQIIGGQSDRSCDDCSAAQIDSALNLMLLAYCLSYDYHTLAATRLESDSTSDTIPCLWSVELWRPSCDSG